MTLPRPLTWSEYIAHVFKNEPDRICTEVEKQAWLEAVIAEKERPQTKRKAA